MIDTERLHQTIEDFCVFFETLPPEALREQEWGPMEVLAHLVYWHESYVAQAEAALAGVPFIPPEGRFREMNAQAVARDRGKSAQEQLARLRRADLRLCLLARDERAADISIETKQGAKRRPLQDFLNRVEAHIRSHHLLLRRRERRRVSAK